MITRTRRPARWGMLLALPVLLAVTALSCTKEDGAASASQKVPPPPPPPPPPPNQAEVFKVKLLKDSLDLKIIDDVDQQLTHVYSITVVGKSAKRLNYSLSSKEDFDRVTRGISIQGISLQKMQKPVIVPDNQ